MEATEKKELEETPRKPGQLARAAKAREEKANAPVDMETMLGLPATVSLMGLVDGERRIVEYQVYPVTLGRMKAFSAAMEKLGELGLFLLVEDKPEAIQQLNKVLRRDAGEAVEITNEDAKLGLKMMLLQPGADQVEAMIEIAEAVLNGPGQTFTCADIEEMLTPMAFAEIYRMAVKISGLNP